MEVARFTKVEVMTEDNCFPQNTLRVCKYENAASASFGCVLPNVLVIIFKLNTGSCAQLENFSKTNRFLLLLSFCLPNLIMHHS